LAKKKIPFKDMSKAQKKAAVAGRKGLVVRTEKALAKEREEKNV
jgi:hypothetical protein